MPGSPVADEPGGGIFGGMDNHTATMATVDPRHVSYTHLMYALHALSIIIGLSSAAFIITAFLFGIPSIIAVVMNYVRRDAVRGTWLDSHFRWQLRTFWWSAALWLASMLLFGVLVLVLIGIPLIWASWIAIGIWALYRVARGWLALNHGRSLPT